MLMWQKETKSILDNTLKYRKLMERVKCPIITLQKCDLNIKKCSKMYVPNLIKCH